MTGVSQRRAPGRSEMALRDPNILRLGIDVGSTTVKAVVLDPADGRV